VEIKLSALLWLISYLDTRKQQVKVNGTLSDDEIVECGVPQGTSISPTLFNIQMSNVFSILLKSEIVCYADDTAIICFGENWDEINYTIKLDL